ncbi:MAG: ParB/RepB/Spo0J family partition protein [Ruminococcus sp.]|nr:ParB/RepB/Spo0J family partition protein [Candidatus Copronaster equi]
MSRHSANNIELSAFDDMFETDESRADMKRERIFDIPISDIKNFPNHPYKVLDDERMTELVESIKDHGLLQPVLVRPIENGKYEMVSGHRRKRAFEIAGFETIPCRVQEMTLEEATITMVESNCYRETILPSEKAKAYKMRLDAMNRQGQRTDLSFSPVAKKLNSAKEFADSMGESKDNIYRYIRLNNLIPELLELVDEGRMKLRPAVEISYLTEDEQRNLLNAIEMNDATPSHAQAIRMRKLSAEGNLTTDSINDIMCEEKPNQKEKPQFRDKRIADAIPKNIPPENHSDYVLKAVEFYNRHLQRARNERSR